jgi:dipeptidyl aminopeptidase/acylaminoacyl peptidase
MSEVETKTATRPFQPADALRLTFPAAAGLLRDGDCFYTVSQIAEDLSTETTTLWLRESATGTARRIAEGFDSVRSPVASPDGGRIAFVAKVDDEAQICIVSIGGGEVEVLTRLEQGVGGGLEWSPDGQSIAFTAGSSKRRDPKAPYWVTRTTYRFDGLGFLDDAVQDIYVLGVETRTVRQLTADRTMNAGSKWSPDGTQLLFLVSFEPDIEWSFQPQLHVVDVASGTRRVVLGEEWGGIVSAVWAQDGEHIIFVGATANDAMPFFVQKFDLWTVKTTGGEPPVCHSQSLPAGAELRVVTDWPNLDLISGNHLCLSATADAVYISAQIGVNIGIYRLGLATDSIEPVLTDPGAHVLLNVDQTDRLLYLFSTLNDPPDLFVSEGHRQTTRRRITALNDELLDDIAQSDVRWFAVTAPDGQVLDACLLTPRDVAPPYPTILCIHGGPYGAHGDVFLIDFSVMVGAGFAVLFSNFRGSSGYGNEFMQAMFGRWGAVGMVDHLAAVDHAVELGVADPNRLGVYGISHGGFATCWLLGNTDRFRAGIAENPVTNWTTKYGVADAPLYVTIELGGRPHEVPDVYAERSPLTYAPHCTTPLLFIIGEQDHRCPPGEAEQYYRVLKTNGCPTAMLRLPNSSHIGSSTGPPAARAAQNEALVEWFTRYVTDEL